MNRETQWWLHNTSAGRRTLERVLPAGAIPLPTRRQMCRERGHDELGDGSCRRCGARPDCAECGRELTPAELSRVRAGRGEVEHGRPAHAIRVAR